MEVSLKEQKDRILHFGKAKAMLKEQNGLILLFGTVKFSVKEQKQDFLLFESRGLLALYLEIIMRGYDIGQVLSLLMLRFSVKIRVRAYESSSNLQQHKHRMLLLRIVESANLSNRYYT